MNGTPSSRRQFLRHLSVGAGAAALGTVLGGCVVAPLPGPHGPYQSEPGPEVGVAPPPPQSEVSPPPPGPAYVWIGGYWTWRFGRYVWVGGRWAVPPTGYFWVPGHWARVPQGWRWHGGYWRAR
jgi:hypothetical protein